MCKEFLDILQFIVHFFEPELPLFALFLGYLFFFSKPYIGIRLVVVWFFAPRKMKLFAKHDIAGWRCFK